MELKFQYGHELSAKLVGIFQDVSAVPSVGDQILIHDSSPLVEIDEEVGKYWKVVKIDWAFRKTDSNHETHHAVVWVVPPEEYEKGNLHSN